MRALVLILLLARPASRYKKLPQSGEGDGMPVHFIILFQSQGLLVLIFLGGMEYRFCAVEIKNYLCLFFDN